MWRLRISGGICPFYNFFSKLCLSIVAQFPEGFIATVDTSIGKTLHGRGEIRAVIGGRRCQGIHFLGWNRFIVRRDFKEYCLVFAPEAVKFDEFEREDEARTNIRKKKRIRRKVINQSEIIESRGRHSQLYVVTCVSFCSPQAFQFLD